MSLQYKQICHYETSYVVKIYWNFYICVRDLFYANGTLVCDDRDIEQNNVICTDSAI